MAESLKRRVKSVVEGKSPAARAFDWTIQALILVSLITFSLSTLPNLNAAQRFWLDAIELVTVAVFTAEYLTRIWIAERKRDYIFSFYGMIDFLAILPFYLQATVDLRSLRIFRLLRLLRLLKILRYAKALRQFQRAFAEARDELILLSFATAFMLFLASVGIYYFENEAQPDKFSSIFDCFWWAVATLTTVGYGDIYPVTVGGRVFTFVILIIGIGFVAAPTGLLASALTKVRVQNDEAADAPPDEE